MFLLYLGVIKHLKNDLFSVRDLKTFKISRVFFKLKCILGLKT